MKYAYSLTVDDNVNSILMSTCPIFCDVRQTVTLSYHKDRKQQEKLVQPCLKIKTNLPTCMFKLTNQLCLSYFIYTNKIKKNNNNYMVLLSAGKDKILRS